MIKFSIDIGVDKIKFSNPERSLNHSKQHYGTYKQIYYRDLQYILELQEKYKGKIKIMNVTNPTVGCMDVGIPGLRGCIEGQELLAINPDGRITYLFLMNDTILGKYEEYNSIKKFLLESQKLKEYIAKIDYIPCHSCTLYSKCRGGCQVRKIVEYGEIKEKDPLCPQKYHLKQSSVHNEQTRNTLFQEVYVSHSL